MPRSLNFKKLKNGIADQNDNSNKNVFKQSMISKFFLPKNTPLSEKKYDELLRSSKKAKTSENSDGNIEDVDMPTEGSALMNLESNHTDEFSSSREPTNNLKKTSMKTLNKLKSFSVDSERISESVAVSKHKNIDSPKLPFRTDSEDPMSSGISGSEEERDSECDDDEAEKPRNKFKRFKSNEGKYQKKSNSSKVNVKYTPLEQQFMKIKEEHKDTILFIECGYKYRFFGTDAEIASKELNIYCHLDHNFMTASIPTHRLFVHVRRLVSKGYKVGVVKQTETAALKATGDNKSGPFSRELTALYTKSTLVGEDVNPILKIENDDAGVDNTTPNYLLAVSEEMNSDKGKKTTIGLIAVQPVTGEIIYDCFDDDIARPELECRLSHIRPVEVLLPLKNLSKETENVIEDFAEVNFNADDCIRIEKLPDELFDYSSALKDVTSFFEEENEDIEKIDVQQIVSLPASVICSLSAILQYLKEFRLDRILKESSRSISKFTIMDSHLILSASTVRNLEIFQNLANGSVEGSLFWIMDHTQTKFGSRLLRKWISQPLKNIKEIEMRQDIIEELVTNSSSFPEEVRKMLKKLPDVEKGVGAIYHRKCSTAAFICIAKALSSICQEFKGIVVQVESEFKVNELKQLFVNIVEGLQSVDSFIEIIDEAAAREGDKTKLFLDLKNFPQVQKIKNDIAAVIVEIKGLRNSIRQVLRLPAFDYTTVSGQKFLIEVRNAQLKAVPNTWTKISSTKQVVRFRSPEVEALVTKLKQLEEQLVIACNEAWNTYLNKFNKHYCHYKQAILQIGLLDCFLSLAEVAKQHGYTRPLFVEHSTVIQIEQGYHPIVPMLFKEEEQYVPNNTDLDVNAKHCMIITGPNMGGKSSYIRQVALICIMAQIGSFVPANVATLSILDGIHTRMGASDEIYQGRSTFMVELQEASQIMQQATSKSLVILDELGRGTSTHDGVAIAYATLNYFVNEVKCLVLFVTHYPELTEFEKLHPDKVSNFHMDFLINEADSDANDVEKITFLYQLVEGTADCSYGLNVARLADIPKEILKKASQKSKQMGASNNKKRSNNIFLKKLWTCSPDCLIDMLQDLKD